MFNLIQGAYVVRKGLSAPYVTEYRDERGENMESFVFRKSVDYSTAAPPPPLTPPAGTAAVTTGLINSDIGDASPGGGATYGNGVWTVTGGGSDIWGGLDSYHFAYREVTGDFTLIAKVTSMKDAGAKAGLVIRDSLAPDAPRRLYIGLTPSANGLVATHLRGYTADSHNKPDEQTHRGATIPHWFKVQRIGSRITIFHSADGGSWTPGQNGEYAGWTGKAYAGLAVCSRANGTPTSATFEEVRITGGDGNEPPKAPAAPAQIYASPGDKMVPLRWLESFGATSYTVKRAIAPGGPFTAVAIVHGASYGDTAAPVGVKCYYVVAARNAAGESADSPEDAATSSSR